jgi:hypothetical protein
MTNEMWGHKCSDGSGMAIAKGEPCNWCDATEPAAPAQAAEPVANERDKFEAFARSRPGRLALDLETWSIDDDGYTSSDTAFAWEVWQARAALAAAPQPAEPSADERERVLREHRLYRAGIVAAPAATVPDGVPVVQEAQPSLTERLQQKCSDWGTYWRAPDAHGVVLTQEQALELLRDALGVEVELQAASGVALDAYPDPKAPGLPKQRRIVRDLIDVARAAFTAADDTEDAGDPDFVKMDRAGYDALSAALDVLDELPDDQPDVTMSGPARAEWALRALLDGICANPADGVETSDKPEENDRA